MVLLLKNLQTARQELKREKERIANITETLANCNKITERTTKLEEKREKAILKIEALEALSRQKWHKIEAELLENEVHHLDISAIRKHFFELKSWNEIEGCCNNNGDATRKRITRLAEALVVIPGEL